MGAYEDLCCIVPKNALTTGENVLKIVYGGGTAASVEKFSAAHGTFKKGDSVAFDVAAGELLGGWNDLNFQFISNSGYVTFDYYRLAISDYNPGTFLIVR